MPVHPNTIANLKPPWPKGVAPQTSRSSRQVRAAVAKLRNSSPDAVDYVIACLHDESLRPDLRVKCALAIIEKVIPDHKSIDPSLAISQGIQTLTVEFVSGNSVTIERQHKQIPPAGPVIDAESVPADLADHSG